MSSVMPLESLLINPSPEIPKSRSILSRFSSALSKHAREPFDISIEPRDPYKTYSPGDHVAGEVILTVAKGFDITHLVIALHGYVMVYKHQVSAGDSPAVPDVLLTTKGTRGFEYHGNGLVSLFQTEATLCGAGFLQKRQYKFGFDLKFPLDALPSTIDFERGTVAYMICATVTRPTAMSPVTTRYRNVKFQTRIDVGPMQTPKTKAITLEPISRRGKVKKVKPASSLSASDLSQRRPLSRTNTTSSLSRTIDPDRPPLSPAPSEDTIPTRRSSSTQEFQLVEQQSLSTTSVVSSPDVVMNDARSSTSLTGQTITATAELQRHGALPGDTVPIRVSVTHTKAEARGVIVATLYRLCRVDMYPVAMAATPNRKGKGKKLYVEELYPPSRTGLGGLYFGNGSPSSTFRNDLAQSSGMMIVDPRTLTAEVKLNVKIPDNAFPTMSKIPGDMISFTYHIEVVIDLCGKLGETRLLPRLTTTDPIFTSINEMGPQLSTDWANNILDTTQLRRTKSVATFEFGLLVGSTDASRVKVDLPPQPSIQADASMAHEHSKDLQQQDMWYYGSEDGYYYDEEGYPYYSYQDYLVWQQEHGSVPTAVLDPPVGIDESLDEKERMRRHEQSLIPSQPPPEASSAPALAAIVPSAPTLTTLEDPSSENNLVSRTINHSAETIVPSPSSSPQPIPYGDVPSRHGVASEDKREMEQQRLSAQASAPPIDGESQPTTYRPSATAPTIEEEDEYISQQLDREQARRDAARGPEESLPVYQR